MEKKLYPLDVGQMLQYLPDAFRTSSGAMSAFVSGSLPRIRTGMYSSTSRNGMTGMFPSWTSPTSP